MSVSGKMTRHALDAAVAAMPPIRFAPAARAVLGCIQIPTDFVLDKEGPALIERFPGVELRLQKMEFNSDRLDVATFEAAAENVARAAATLRPPSRCTVLGVACTSFSFELGAERIDRQLREAAPRAATTDMARAQAAALAALGARRVSLLTPYIRELADANARMLTARAGVEVVRRATMGLDRDELTSAVDARTIAAWARAVDCEAADAVVVGCSAFRAAESGFIDELEAALGKPVVTSTQAFMWSMLRMAGVSDRIGGYGSLFSRC